MELTISLHPFVRLSHMIHRQRGSCDVTTGGLGNRLTVFFTVASHIIPCVSVGLKEMLLKRKLPKMSGLHGGEG